ncbi:YoaK family protein [Sphingobacterium faecium]|uniref:YoaK family protein n=1 Tax=Sphingobacterium faecium TaxID=34087 RepID=UPI00247B04C8|nr:YoaK family protein [Sphingobacterium faecium]WGQ15809.1 YoaK family protein [Sphingobacterium faecium]
MLRKYSNHRTIQDNIKLGALTAFSAGMVNVASVIVFFSFTSNVTGYYAIFAQEIAKGNWYQGAVVLFWILLFLVGSMLSNMIIIHGKGRFSTYLTHSIPLGLEIFSILFVGIYLDFFYKDSLQETEVLVGALLFAMGLQNGLTATISNFVVKTTHLTGLTTDLAILISMFTKESNRHNKALVDKFHLLLSIVIAYVAGGLISGLSFAFLTYKTFYIVCFVLLIIGFYDYYKLYIIKKQYLQRHRQDPVSV